MSTITIYTELPLTEKDLEMIRKTFKEKIVYVPHDNTIIEYIERDYVNPKNMTELLECLNKKGR